MNPKVSIIILNWNRWKDTIECLESLYQITYPNYDVILVDNGSEDESITRVKEYCEGKIKVVSKFFEYSLENKPLKIIEYTRGEAEAGGSKEKEIADLPSDRNLILIKNEKNYGFAGGNNIAMRYALRALNPEYVVLLNNDTVVDKEFLSELVNVAENDEQIGIVGPKIYYYHNPGSIWAAGGVIDFKKGICRLSKSDIKNTLEVNYISGCASLITSRIINEIGFLDEAFFMYFEDTDWNMRIKMKGYRILCVPKSVIWHKVASSTLGIKVKFSDPIKSYFNTRNRIWFFKRYVPERRYLIYALLYLFGEVFVDLLRNRNFSMKNIGSIAKGIWDGLSKLS